MVMVNESSEKILVTLEQLMRQNPKIDVLRSCYASLRTAILDEVQRSGHCVMLEQILRNKPERIPLVAFKALMDVYDYLFKRYPLGQIRENCVYYPMKQEAFVFSIGYMEINRYHFWNMASDFERHYKKGTKQSTLCHINLGTLGKSTEQGRISAETGPAGASPGCSVSHTKAAASTEQTGAQEEIRLAREEAASIRKQAEADAASIIQNAKEEYQKKIEQANKLCHEQIQQAQEKYDAVLASAEQDARNTFEAKKQELLEAYFAQQQQKMNEIAVQNQKTQEATARTAEQQINSMSGEASKLQAELVDTVTTAMDALSAFKLDMCTKLSDWRTDLYKAKYRSLVHSYLSLYNLGKQNVSQKLRTAVQLPETSDPEVLRQQNTELTEQIKAIYEQISLLCRMMEQAMAQLGILVYFPKEGDAFDAYLHVHADADTAERNTITACIVPGIRIAGDQGSVIYQAQVR